MDSSVSWFIGLRYSGTRSNSLFLSFISLISLIGVTLGVVALTIVVSVMNGFDSELKRRILGSVPHIVIDGITELDERVANDERVRAVAPFVRRQGMLVNGVSDQLVGVYGIVPEKESRISEIPAHVNEPLPALLASGSNRMVIGKGLARRTGLDVGDLATLVIPEPSPGGKSVTPKIGQVEVSGFFELGSELDYRLILLHIDDLKAIIGSAKSSYRLSLHDVFAATGVVRWLADGLAPGAKVSDWTREYGNFFETVRMEKVMMFILLALVIAIAAFNIISSLSMMVKEKQADIAVLRTLGMSSSRVMMIFVIQGGLIGVLGTVLGILVGLPLAIYIPEIVNFFEQALGGRMLAGTYFDRVPSDVRAPDMAVVLLVSLTITMLATLYPAWRAARLRPAEVLHADV
ncbi:MAG: lipoprotein-releasing ABC transporter permease subunit [Pseudomonadales bacterium]